MDERECECSFTPDGEHEPGCPMEHADELTCVVCGFSTKDNADYTEHLETHGLPSRFEVLRSLGASFEASCRVAARGNYNPFTERG